MEFILLLLKNQWRSFYLRKVLYLWICPLMSAMLLGCLVLNSYRYLFMCAFSYFLMVDAIAIPARDIILDISRFFRSCRSMRHVLLAYAGYRLATSFALNFLPALMVFVVVMIVPGWDFALLPPATSIGVFMFAWLLFVLVTIPLLILAVRWNMFYQLYGFLVFPFYSIGLVVHFQKTFHAEILEQFLIVVLIIVIAVSVFVAFSFRLLLSREVLFPEKGERKIGL